MSQTIAITYSILTISFAQLVYTLISDEDLIRNKIIYLVEQKAANPNDLGYLYQLRQNKGRSLTSCTALFGKFETVVEFSIDSTCHTRLIYDQDRKDTEILLHDLTDATFGINEIRLTKNRYISRFKAAEQARMKCGHKLADQNALIIEHLTTLPCMVAFASDTNSLQAKLMEAVQKGDVAAADEITSSERINVNQIWPNGNSYLHDVNAEAPEMVSLFASNGMYLDYYNQEGRTPLHAAIVANKPKIVDALIQRGASTSLKTHFSSSTKPCSAFEIALFTFDQLKPKKRNKEAIDNAAQSVQLLWSAKECACTPELTYSLRLQSYYEYVSTKTKHKKHGDSVAESMQATRNSHVSDPKIKENDIKDVPVKRGDPEEAQKIVINLLEEIFSEHKKVLSIAEVLNLYKTMSLQKHPDKQGADSKTKFQDFLGAMNHLKEPFGEKIYWKVIESSKYVNVERSTDATKAEKEYLELRTRRETVPQYPQYPQYSQYPQYPQYSPQYSQHRAPRGAVPKYPQYRATQKQAPPPARDELIIDPTLWRRTYRTTNMFTPQINRLIKYDFSVDDLNVFLTDFCGYVTLGNYMKEQTTSSSPPAPKMANTGSILPAWKMLVLARGQTTDHDMYTILANAQNKLNAVEQLDHTTFGRLVFNTQNREQFTELRIFLSTQISILYNVIKKAFAAMTESDYIEKILKETPPCILMESLTPQYNTKANPNIFELCVPIGETTIRHSQNYETTTRLDDYSKHAVITIVVNKRTLKKGVDKLPLEIAQSDYGSPLIAAHRIVGVLVDAQVSTNEPAVADDGKLFSTAITTQLIFDKNLIETDYRYTAANIMC